MPRSLFQRAVVQPAVASAQQALYHHAGTAAAVASAAAAPRVAHMASSSPPHQLANVAVTRAALAAASSVGSGAPASGMLRRRGGAVVRSSTQVAVPSAAAWGQQKRHICIGFQGSGVARDDESSVKAQVDAYEGEHKALIGGPGWHDRQLNLLDAKTFRVELPGGVQQTHQGQDARLVEAQRAHAAAYRAGDRELHLAGHSRGGGNALLYAQHVAKHGLLCPDTGERLAEPGLGVDSLSIYDAVPHMGAAGLARAVGEDGERQVVPYEQLRVPKNVSHYQHFFAGGDVRNEFRQANIPAASPHTTSSHVVVPNARHNEVGGRPGGNEDAINLTVSEAMRHLHEQGLPFSVERVLSSKKHNAALARLRESQPAPGLVEQAIAVWGGASEREFPHYARPMAMRPEEGSASAPSAPVPTGNAIAKRPELGDGAQLR